MKFLVTGGAGFIGSHLVRRLAADGAEVRAVDDFSTGHRGNLDGTDAEIVEVDLVTADFVPLVAGREVIFHHAAVPHLEEPRDAPAQLAGAQPALRERARQSAERAVRADPRNPVSHAGASQIYIVLGDGEFAVREAAAALELAPGSVEYEELSAAALLVARRPAEALAAI